MEQAGQRSSRSLGESSGSSTRSRAEEQQQHGQSSSTGGEKRQHGQSSSSNTSRGEAGGRAPPAAVGPGVVGVRIPGAAGARDPGPGTREPGACGSSRRTSSTGSWREVQATREGTAAAEQSLGGAGDEFDDHGLGDARVTGGGGRKETGTYF